MPDTSLYIQRLLETNPIREPLLRSIIQSLQLPPGSRGLDAGSGIGHQAILLAEAVGPEGRITGLDTLPDLLAYGTEMVEKAGLSDQITFREGDVGHLPFDDDSFDWAWSADCIGLQPGYRPVCDGRGQALCGQCRGSDQRSLPRSGHRAGLHPQ
jgi:demethylmenaquinone methyltransferase/2-methoxy-6-polyprenyl-1,4-benzoquinol methylase